MEDFFSRFKPKPRKRKPQLGIIYVLHFERPYKHARHYVGWTSKEEIDSRIEQHLSGRGSPLVKAVIEAGIGVTVAATMPGTRDMERHLKNRHDNRGVCPVCREEWLEKKKMNTKRSEITLREVRELVRSILREAICPVCGGRGAYVGMNDVECPNKACSKFSVKQLQTGSATVGVKSIELDWADDDNDPDGPNGWKSVSARLGLTAQEVGQSSGWPIVRFMGPEDKIKELVRVYNAGSGEDDSFWLDQMKDA